MAVTAKPLIDAQYVENSLTTEYTVGGSITSAIIDKFTITNVTGGAITFDLHIVQTGNTADASNKIYDTLSVAANTCIALDEIQNHILDTGDFIALNASAATSLVMRCSGREVS